ncbi:MAG TPA: hypothetical protein DDY37_05355 [Legionella sp.]|nr:hypothetical protein [Legionella sp.]
MRFISTGHYVPKIKVNNEDLSEKSDWIQNKIGIRTRYKAEEGQTTADLAVQAGLSAFENAWDEVNPEDIDLIIGVTSSPDVTAPSMACIVQGQLGLVNAHAFDLGAVCTGFVYALNVAHSMLHKYKTIMIVAAERYSNIIDYQRRDNFFFGDGAGAIIITDTDEPTLFMHHMYSHGEFKDLFVTREKFEMDAKGVYDYAIKHVTESLQRFDTERARWIIPHQPNISLLSEIAKICGIPLTKFLMNLEEYGNIAGATIPATLSRHRSSISNGDVIILTAVGAGMTGGTIMMEFRS